MSVLEHYCNEARGGNPKIRELTDVDVDVETTLYSGRTCILDSNGDATEGYGTDQTDVCYFAHRGVDHIDVSDLSVVSDNLDVSAMNSGNISLIPFRPGLKVQTSEYDSNESYSMGDPVEITGSDTGTLTKATDATAGTVVARVAKEETSSVQGVDVLTVEVIKIAPDLTT